MPQRSFSPESLATFDALGRRYGCFPSRVAGINENSGYGLLFDIRCFKEGVELEQMESTVTGEYNRKKMSWDKDTYNDLKRKYR